MLWTETTPEMFDTDVKPAYAQTALFAAPDKCGTPDMFVTADETPAAPELAECPQCGSRELPAYLERHVARHARLERDHAERLELDARATAAYGPVRPA